MLTKAWLLLHHTLPGLSPQEATSAWEDEGWVEPAGGLGGPPGGDSTEHGQPWS